MEPRLLLIIAVMSITGLIVLCTFILLAIKMLTGGRRKKNASTEEEAQMIQEIFQGLVQMERRVEALETILFDKEAQENRR